MSVKDVAKRLSQKKRVYPVQTDEGTIYVRGLNGAERNEYFKLITDGSTDMERLVANQRLLASQLCNEDGTAAFDSLDEAFEAVLQWDISTYVKPAVDEILKVSGLSKESQEDAAKK